MEEQTFKSPLSQAHIKVISAMIRFFSLLFFSFFSAQSVTAYTVLYIYCIMPENMKIVSEHGGLIT